MYKILFKNNYDYFHNLEIIFLGLDNFRDKIINFVQQEQVLYICFDLLQKKALQSVEPSVVIYSIIIDGLCKGGLINDAQNLCFDMIFCGISPNIFTNSSLIHGFCIAGEFKLRSIWMVQEIIVKT